VDSFKLLGFLTLDKDFSVSSDALETFAAIFTAERKQKLNANVELDAFIA
jgi:hypothetical protein